MFLTTKWLPFLQKDVFSRRCNHRYALVESFPAILFQAIERGPCVPRHAGGSPALSLCFLYREYHASMSGDMDMISSRKFLSTTSDLAFAIHSGCDFG